MILPGLLSPCSVYSRVDRQCVLGHALALLIVLSFTDHFTANAHTDCYWPDGTVNDQHQPCSAPLNEAFGLCCGLGDLCLSNGLCMSHSNTPGAQNNMIYYRGSCMSRDWEDSSNCPTICVNGTGISPHTDIGVIPCPDSNTKWYCADKDMSKANCSSGAFIVSMPSMFSSVHHSFLNKQTGI